MADSNNKTTRDGSGDNTHEDDRTKRGNPVDRISPDEPENRTFRGNPVDR